jgi:hypothetical protein
MKITKFILTLVVVVLVGGGIASAAPHLFSATGHRDTVEPSESPSSEPSESPEPTDTPEATGAPSTGTPSTGPDFSVCAGLTGLENAICRHGVLLQLHPDNTGLQNSLSHLLANLSKHQSSSHGQSGQSHGNVNG